MSSREDLVSMAKLAEQAERPDEMIEFVKRVIEIVVNKNELPTEEERNLLSVAYKNLVGLRRASFKALGAVETKTTDDHLKKLAKSYKEKIFHDLTGKCKEVLQILEEQLLPLATENVDSKVFFLKMRGDYYRYMAEPNIDTNRSRKENIKTSQDSYESAWTACEILPSTHPAKLGLALNYSVFHYEILEDKNKACNIAKAAFDEALSELDNSKGDSYKDATLIMQLLRDNLVLWTEQEGGEQH
ncbi:14-3-3 protein homolog 1-like isoform X5 [Symsagittifera roscoffensis]|uniref:14-3-3 protein homolog 1-like isoform X5 n=1 Tax=Symsagittifera roscoffensis TaxID=84072 RepID=UPI00307CC6C3